MKGALTFLSVPATMLYFGFLIWFPVSSPEMVSNHSAAGYWQLNDGKGKF